MAQNQVIPAGKTAGESSFLVNDDQQQQQKGKKRDRGGICIHEAPNNNNNASAIISSTTCSSSENKKKSKRIMLGFRFCPTDQELITLFLQKKIRNDQVRFRDVHHVNIYDSTPQELAANFKRATGGDKWYFFSSRERKYPNGTRPSRGAGSGFWKATGSDSLIVDKDNVTIGRKKSLVYHQGDHKKSVKTNWLMHEYKVYEGPSNIQKNDNAPKEKLLDMVLCRIYKNTKSSGKKPNKAPGEVDVSHNSDQDTSPVSQALQIQDTAPAAATNYNNSTVVAGDTINGNVVVQQWEEPALNVADEDYQQWLSTPEMNHYLLDGSTDMNTNDDLLDWEFLDGLTGLGDQQQGL